MLSALQIGTLTVTILPLVSARAVGAPITRQSSNLIWSDCPDSDTTQCAFFDVPRDYSNPTEDDTVSIFMRKLPANVSAENRLGTIITNPSGLGSPGGAFILNYGEQLSTIVEDRYDISGFDSRGVNLTAPWTNCFTTEADAVLLEYQMDVVPYLPSSLDVDRALVKKLSAIQAEHNAACLANGNRKMLESVGTASVVQDMVRMVEALGEDSINYWGWSYGTVLGSTFAAMRPDLVNRMVLDGVVNAESYYNDVWQFGRDGMVDTHKTLTGFLSTCAEAGPKHCAFAVPPEGSNTTQTTETLRDRLNAIYTRLNERPITVARSPVGPGIFTASDLQKSLLSILYDPGLWSGAMQGNVQTANILTKLEQGDVEDAYTGIYGSYANVTRQPYDANVFNRSMQRHSWQDSSRMIACSDAAPVNVSVDVYTNYFRELGRISPVGEQWASQVGICNGWSFRANQRYTGPWSTTDGLKKTKFPILFLSQDADPESATLLIQHGFGHTTSFHPSLCTYKNTRDYFIDGKVPSNGTECTPEPGYIYPTNTNSKRASLDEREVELVGALKKLAEARSSFNPATWGLV
ncbi:hypothetical protein FRC12_020267 [Ceratobasidium sp. 428]|nr:hypothetical protein FRC12_020267 [Ceratobasidium sp. 428]